MTFPNLDNSSIEELDKVKWLSKLKSNVYKQGQSKIK